MELEWGPEKYAENLAKHRVPFELAYAFDWATVELRPTRPGTDAVRYRVFARVGDRLYTAIVTPRGDRVRLISLRPANRRERNLHHENTTR